MAKLHKNFSVILEIFKEVLIENNERTLSKYIPWINQIKNDIPPEKVTKFFHVNSISFQLFNIYETIIAAKKRRNEPVKIKDDAKFGKWNYILTKYKKEGISEQRIVNRFKKVRIEPVLTAHPTEPKRPIVLRLYRELYILIEEFENSIYQSVIWDEKKTAIKQILHKLFFVEEFNTVLDPHNVAILSPYSIPIHSNHR